MAREVSKNDSVQIFWSAYHPGDVVEVKIQNKPDRLVYVSENVLREREAVIKELNDKMAEKYGSDTEKEELRKKLEDTESELDKVKKQMKAIRSFIDLVYEEE